MKCLIINRKWFHIIRIKMIIDTFIWYSVWEIIYYLFISWIVIFLLAFFHSNEWIDYSYLTILYIINQLKMKYVEKI